MYYFVDKSGFIQGFISYLEEKNIEQYKKENNIFDIVFSEDELDPDYYIYKNNTFTRLSEEEVQEKISYGKILTADEKAEIEEEKKIALLRPTREEVERAETQLMVLDTMEAMNE